MSIEVPEEFGGSDELRLLGFPWIHHERLRNISDGGLAHLHPMMSLHQAYFAIGVPSSAYQIRWVEDVWWGDGHGGVVGRHDLVCLLLEDRIACHLVHPPL